MTKKSLHPDRQPGHQADQAERLAMADLRLTQHLTRFAGERHRPLPGLPKGSTMMFDSDDDFPALPMDPECNTIVPERVARADDGNYWTCPGCGCPDFYMGDPRCPRCGWNGR